MVSLLHALCVLVSAAPQNQGYYMQPSLHGDAIVFVSLFTQTIGECLFGMGYEAWAGMNNDWHNVRTIADRIF